MSARGTTMRPGKNVFEPGDSQSTAHDSRWNNETPRTVKTRVGTNGNKFFCGTL